eukprot:SAG31_NODE_151_length_22216_cov_37.572139_18_plen_171_part_00
MGCEECYFLVFVGMFFVFMGLIEKVSVTLQVLRIIVRAMRRRAGWLVPRGAGCGELRGLGLRLPQVRAIHNSLFGALLWMKYAEMRTGCASMVDFVQIRQLRRVCARAERTVFADAGRSQSLRCCFAANSVLDRAIRPRPQLSGAHQQLMADDDRRQCNRRKGESEPRPQ